eukprot:TRINITY_DN22864_c0_g1_i1.p1 TRINITY_DN22864_c0_g1~~TRINITY_DN22864_c0_g1_i1.p1  ORF type:complete len:104 (-),score=26.39 TRINITY_DN22864_c0_g1_i1:137-448(-)
MDAAVERASREGSKRITLTQDASNYLTLALYAKMGFKVKTHLAEFVGKSLSTSSSDSKFNIRPLELNDVETVCQLWQDACGYSMKILVNIIFRFQVQHSSIRT